MTLPVVAIVGRPNVGKSTLFNRIYGARLAVVDDIPGITRDRLIAAAEWGGVRFHLVDTGGWIPEARERMDEAILAQVLRAVEECDQILLVVDARQGLHPHDEMIARELFRRDLPTLLVANKVDHQGLEAHAGEFGKLGFARWIPVSAMEGRGVGDLLDAVVAGLRARGRVPAAPLPTTTSPSDQSEVVDPAPSAAEENIRVAIVGRPNVGKSSLVNHLLGKERMIVDEKPGTTRDAVDSPLKFHGRALTLVDTAGIRRRLTNQPSFEFYATLRAVRALERSDVAVLVLDATQPIQRQDVRIASLIEEAGVGCVLAINKWDLPEKDDATMGTWVRQIREDIPFLSHAPMVFLSAKSGQRISKLPEAAVQVYETTRKEIGTAEWNEVLSKAVDQNPPRSRGGGQRPVKIYYATQVQVAPPTVALFVSDPKRMAPDYLRYLMGRFREAFRLEGAPIRLLLRKS